MNSSRRLFSTLGAAILLAANVSLPPRSRRHRRPPPRR